MEREWHSKRSDSSSCSNKRTTTTSSGGGGGGIVSSSGTAVESRKEALDELEEEWADLDAEGRADAVIIETTGLATPAPIIQLFFADLEVRRQCRLDAVIAVVDAKHVWNHLTVTHGQQQQRWRYEQEWSSTGSAANARVPRSTMSQGETICSASSPREVARR